MTDETQLSRRTLLQLSAGASLTALAGCSNNDTPNRTATQTTPSETSTTTRETTVTAQASLTPKLSGGTLYVQASGRVDEITLVNPNGQNYGTDTLQHGDGAAAFNLLNDTPYTPGTYRIIGYDTAGEEPEEVIATDLDLQPEFSIRGLHVNRGYNVNVIVENSGTGPLKLFELTIDDQTITPSGRERTMEFYHDPILPAGERAKVEFAYPNHGARQFVGSVNGRSKSELDKLCTGNSGDITVSANLAPLDSDTRTLTATYEGEATIRSGLAGDKWFCDTVTYGEDLTPTAGARHVTETSSELDFTSTSVFTNISFNSDGVMYAHLDKAGAIDKAVLQNPVGNRIAAASPAASETSIKFDLLNQSSGPLARSYEPGVYTLYGYTQREETTSEASGEDSQSYQQVAKATFTLDGNFKVVGLGSPTSDEEVPVTLKNTGPAPIPIATFDVRHPDWSSYDFRPEWRWDDKAVAEEVVAPGDTYTVNSEGLHQMLRQDSDSDEPACSGETVDLAIELGWNGVLTRHTITVAERGSAQQGSSGPLSDSYIICSDPSLVETE